MYFGVGDLICENKLVFLHVMWDMLEPDVVTLILQKICYGFCWLTYLFVVFIINCGHLILMHSQFHSNLLIDSAYARTHPHTPFYEC